MKMGYLHIDPSFGEIFLRESISGEGNQVIVVFEDIVVLVGP